MNTNINNLVESLDELKKAIIDGDLATAMAAHDKANDKFNVFVNENKEHVKFTTSKFGVLSHLLENELGSFLVGNNKWIAECVAIIKKDKSLLNEARFFHALSNYDGSSDAEKYVNEALSFVKENIDRTTVENATNRLANLMFKNGMRLDESITEDYKNFAHACDYILTNNKKLDNLNEYSRNMSVVADYINEHKTTKTDKTLYEECDKFNEQMKELNESERALVNDIISAKKGVVENRQKKLFDKYQNECLKNIDAMIAESNGNDHERLSKIREQVASKSFNPDTIVTDMAKFLEIGSVFSL